MSRITPHVPRRTAGALMAVPVLLLSACSGGSHSARAASSSSAAAAGEKIVTGGGVSVQVPENWQTQSPSPSPDAVLAYGSPDNANGLPSQSVLAILVTNRWPDLISASAARATEVLGAVHGSAQLARTDLTVPGAGPAKVTSMSFPLPGGGTGTLYDLVAITSQNKELIVRVTVQSAPDAQKIADAILASVRQAATA